MNVSRRTVIAGGLETSYLESGPSGNGETLLLLHDGAFGSDAESCWGSVLGLLASRYRVVAPDLLGYGKTRKVVAFDRDPMTYRIEHVRDFCDVLGLTSPIAIGASFGGGMVLRGAARHALPLRAAVSISGPGGIFMRDDAMADLQAFEPTEQWASKVENAMRSLVMGEDDSATARLSRAAVSGHYECLASPRIASPFEKPAIDWRADYVRQLGTVDVPVLLLGGDQDPLVEPEWSTRMAELIPTATVEIIQGGRHLPHLDYPEKVVDVLLVFLERCGF